MKQKIVSNSIPISELIRCLKMKRFNLEGEKALQGEIYCHLISTLPSFKIEREYRLDENNVIDFLINDSIGVEVKISGVKRNLYKQCERYLSFNKIETLLIITNMSIGFPTQLNSKDCYVFKLGMAWL